MWCQRSPEGPTFLSAPQGCAAAEAGDEKTGDEMMWCMMVMLLHNLCFLLVMWFFYFFSILATVTDKQVTRSMLGILVDIFKSSCRLVWNCVLICIYNIVMFHLALWKVTWQIGYSLLNTIILHCISSFYLRPSTFLYVYI